MEISKFAYALEKILLPCYTAVRMITVLTALYPAGGDAVQGVFVMEETTMKLRRKRIAEIIEIGSREDWLSRGYDIFSTAMLFVNLTATILFTFDDVAERFNAALVTAEAVSVAFFAIDYILRIWTAKYSHKSASELRSVWRYASSFTGIIDLLSFLPYYLPFFFPSGAAIFRMFRVVRIFRLFQINAYYDSLSVITQVIYSKKQQLLSSVFIISVLMLASSLCMYSLEHEAQPEIFENVFSGIWWSVSTLLTVGYGDIYPITLMGKIFGIVITFLGVGMVAIPTGIISAGFVEQYSRIKRMSEYASEDDVQFIKLWLDPEDSWVGKTVQELALPHGVIVAMIRRGRENIVPRGDTVLKAEDTVVMGAEAVKDDKHIELKEIVLLKHSPWNGQQIRELDISRQTVIIMVKRGGKTLIPRGELTLHEGDKLIIFSQERVPESEIIRI